MNLQGDFEGLFLTSILQLLCNDQKTGLLQVTSGKNESRVFFEGGTIVYASGSQKETRLGQILRRDGIISAEQLKKCLTLVREQKISLGRILVDKGYVSGETLKKYSTKQVEQILYSLLLWKKGRFEYRDARLNLAGMVIIHLNPMKLILEASRRIDEMSVLANVITSDRLVFKISGKVRNKDEIKLNSNEWRVLSLIDGVHTVRQIITMSGYDEFAVYKILFSVISYGLIEKDEEASAGGLTAGNDFRAIVTVYGDILQAVNRHAAGELGDRAATVFEECREAVDSRFKEMFREYDPSAPAGENLKRIAGAMGEVEDPEEGCDLLIDGFNAYCTLVLANLAGILGDHPVRKIVEEIEKVLGYVEKYQAGSREKSKIVNDVEKIITELLSGFDGGKGKRPKSKGIFSIFS